MRPRLIPTPQQCRLSDRVVLLGSPGAVSLRIEGPEPGNPTAAVAAAWIAEALGIATPGILPGDTWRLAVGDPAAGPALPGEDLPPGAQAEAYRLAAGESGVALAAHAPGGLLAGAATLLQLLSAGDPLCVPEGEILDYPDVPCRMASDWLLNAEINRWSYDWGDGPAACEQRLCRAIDRAARYKISGVLFDGFGWDVGRFPGYAPFMRRVNRSARERGVRLLFTGYNGGYGFHYQTSVLYRGRYLGQVFENRDPFPDGPLYPCFGDPHSSRSRELGTCCANAAQNQAKAREIAAFAAAVHPGALYLHHTDTGYFSDTEAGWQSRCPRCRERWPNDALDAPDGGAGAFAELFRTIAAAVNGLPTEDSYVPARDCLLLFTGPAYTHYAEAGAKEIWDREVRFFVEVSRLLSGVPNAQFVIREQFRTADGRRRVEHLSEALRTEGSGHGVFVIWFGGGDLYHDDHLVAASPVLAPFNAGAAGVTYSCGHALQWPQQLLNAELCWNLRSPLTECPEGYGPAIARFQALVPQRLTPATDAFLDDACERLFGAAAAPAMAALYRLDPDPVATVWWSVTAEVASWEKGYPPVDAEERAARWSRRADSTRQAQSLLCDALSRGVPEGILPEMEWLGQSLATGLRFADLLAALHAGEASAALRERAAALRDRLESEPSGTVEPLGGDLGCRREALAGIEKRIPLT